VVLPWNLCFRHGSPGITQPLWGSRSSACIRRGREMYIWHWW